jgi:hypothetical protein
MTDKHYICSEQGNTSEEERKVRMTLQSDAEFLASLGIKLEPLLVADNFTKFCQEILFRSVFGEIPKAPPNESLDGAELYQDKLFLHAALAGGDAFRQEQKKRLESLSGVFEMVKDKARLNAFREHLMREKILEINTSPLVEEKSIWTSLPTSSYILLGTEKFFMSCEHAAYFTKAHTVFHLSEYITKCIVGVLKKHGEAKWKTLGFVKLWNFLELDMDFISETRRVRDVIAP